MDVLSDCYLRWQGTPGGCPMSGKGGRQCPSSQLHGPKLHYSPPTTSTLRHHSHPTLTLRHHSPPHPHPQASQPPHPQSSFQDYLSGRHDLSSFPSSPTHVLSLLMSVMSTLSRNHPALLPALSWRIRILVRAPSSMAETVKVSVWEGPE